VKVKLPLSFIKQLHHEEVWGNENRVPCILNCSTGWRNGCKIIEAGIIV
jgi:hypothetical protein